MHLAAFFNQIFYQELLSSAIAGLTTGTIVGIIVLKTQRVVTNRAEQAAIMAELSILDQVIQRAKERPLTFIINSAMQSVPQPAKVVAEEIRDRPISQWEVALPQLEELKRLHAFMRTYHSFAGSAAELDDALTIAIRHHNVALSLPATDDPAAIAYFIGRSAGFENEDILPFIERDKSALPWLEAMHKHVSHDPRVRSGTQKYLDYRVKLLARLEAL